MAVTYYINPNDRRYRYVRAADIQANPDLYQYVIPLDKPGGINLAVPMFEKADVDSTGARTNYKNPYNPNTTYFAVDDNGRVINDNSVPFVTGADKVFPNIGNFYTYMPNLGGWVRLPTLRDNGQILDKDLIDQFDTYANSAYGSTVGLSNAAYDPETARRIFMNIYMNNGAKAAKQWADDYFKTVGVSNSGMAGAGAGMAAMTGVEAIPYVLPQTIGLAAGLAGIAALSSYALPAAAEHFTKLHWDSVYKGKSPLEILQRLSELEDYIKENLNLIYLGNGLWDTYRPNSDTFIPWGTAVGGAVSGGLHLYSKINPERFNGLGSKILKSKALPFAVGAVVDATRFGINQYLKSNDQDWNDRSEYEYLYNLINGLLLDNTTSTTSTPADTLPPSEESVEPLIPYVPTPGFE